MTVRKPKRRLLLQGAAGMLACAAWPVRAAGPVPIADMHSHYGMITRRQMLDSGFAEDMRSSGVALVAWKHVADGPWLRSTSTGIEQAGTPRPGAPATVFDSAMASMKRYLADKKVRVVLTRADVDASVAGDPGVVLASEGADFLEGKLDGLEGAYQKGLRHLQLVHYISNAVGDYQTVKPTYNGLTEMGRKLVEACNAKGILVDLAHSTGASVDQALEIAKAPLIWSHGWVDAKEGDWHDPYGFLARRLSLEHAKKIAARGGVIGLWGLGLSRAEGAWPVGRRDTSALASELAKLVDKIGADHVALGTDIEGVGPNWTVNSYADVRKVIDRLQEMKLPDSVVERVAYANYARVLKAALAG